MIKSNTAPAEQDVTVPSFFMNLAKYMSIGSEKISTLTKDKIDYLTNTSCVIAESLGNKIMPYVTSSNTSDGK